MAQNKLLGLYEFFVTDLNAETDIGNAGISCFGKIPVLPAGIYADA
jgi:hypothetical protein